MRYLDSVNIIQYIDNREVLLMMLTESTHADKEGRSCLRLCFIKAFGLKC